MGPPLDLLNLTDSYERKARLLPALLSGSVAIPSIGAVAGGSLSWLSSVSISVGIGALIAVVISYAASAAGRAYEKALWPAWPNDAPTNRWLLPDDETCSRQQKETWYRRIVELTGLDVAAAAGSSETELHRVINDAVRLLRDRIRNSDVGRMLATHNEDYGFARNLAGLRVVWMPTSAASMVVSWIAYAVADTSIVWPLAASAIVAAAVLGSFVLPGYVRQRADRYAESFFAALDQLPAT